MSKFEYFFIFFAVIPFGLLSAEKIIESEVSQINIFAINSKKSNIGFILKSPVNTVIGTTSAIKGEIVISPEKAAEESKTRIEIEAATLDTKNESINKKMKKKHLEVDKFPYIVFESTGIGLKESLDYQPDQPIHFILSGILKLHGIKKEINIPCTLIYYKEENQIMIKGKVTIRMSDYKIRRPVFLLLRVKDEIVIFFHIFAQERRGKNINRQDY